MQEWRGYPTPSPTLLFCRAKYAWLDACGREVAYLTISQLQADKPALMDFVRAAGAGILTRVASSAAGTMTRPGSALAAAAAAAVRKSPFTAFAAAVTAGGAAAQQAEPQQDQQEQKQAQKPQAGALLAGNNAEHLAATSLELPGAANFGGLALSGLGLGGLEGAASFNMELSTYFGSGHGTLKQEPQEQCRVGETPDPAAALGAAAAQ